MTERYRTPSESGQSPRLLLPAVGTKLRRQDLKFARGNSSPEEPDQFVDSDGSWACPGTVTGAGLVRRISMCTSRLGLEGCGASYTRTKATTPAMATSERRQDSFSTNWAEGAACARNRCNRGPSRDMGEEPARHHQGSNTARKTRPCAMNKTGIITSYNNS